MKKLVLVLLAAFVFSGCASIISGSTQEIRISSSPISANVVIYDRHNVKVGEGDFSTPVIAILKRGNGYFTRAKYTVEISKEGYEKQTIEISSGLNGWYWAGNLLIGTWLGWLIVDPISGAMWTLKPDNINAELQQSLSFNEHGKVDGIYVVLKEQIPTDIFNNLELVRIN